jgi:hypothetical protein
MARPLSWIDCPLPWEAPLSDQWSMTWQLESEINEGSERKHHNVLLIGSPESPLYEKSERTLTDSGCSVFNERTKSGVVELLRSRRIDCVVCLNGLTSEGLGSDMTAWLRRKPEGQFLPLIAVGRAQGFASEVRCLYSGADVYCDHTAIDSQLAILVDSLII